MEKKERKVYFIDKEGKWLFKEDIHNHLDLADYIISKDPELQQKFDKIKEQMRNGALFLVIGKGFLQLCDSERYKEVAYFSPSINDRQRMIIGELMQEGYDRIDFAREMASEGAKEIVELILGDEEEQER